MSLLDAEILAASDCQHTQLDVACPCGDPATYISEMSPKCGRKLSIDYLRILMIYSFLDVVQCMIRYIDVTYLR